MTDLENINWILSQIAEELHRARSKNPPMPTPHDGIAVIYEEVEELWAEVRVRIPNPELMRKEAIQIGAMAVRFILDICDKEA